MQKSDRYLNGYRLIYRPDHPSSMRSKNWEGYVYEHRMVAEEHYGVALDRSMVVHHVDGNKLNNDPSNLRIMTRSEHAILHTPSDYLPSVEVADERKQRVRARKRLCVDCGKEVTRRSVRCHDCHQLHKRTVDRPCTPFVSGLVKSIGYEATGRIYGISGTAIRKWLRYT